MAQSNYHKLIGKALADPNFRAQLLDKGKQVGALQSMGIQPTQEVLDALNDAISAVDTFAQTGTLGGDIKEVA